MLRNVMSRLLRPQAVLPLATLLAAPAFALDVPVTDGDRLVIRATSVQITVTAVPGATALKINDGGSGGWNWSRDDRSVIFQGNEPDSRKAVTEALRSPPARQTLTVEGPSIPVEIHALDGTVTLNRGQQEARVTLKNGRVVASQRAGGLRVSGMKTDVTVTDSTGRVDLDVYQGTVSLKNLKADADIDLFGGQMTAEQGQGTWSFTTARGSSKLNKFSGTLQLDLGKGSLAATGLQGRVEGQTGESGVQLQVQPETEINLKSQAGRIQVQLPPASGAALNLVTGDGDISVPSELRVTRTPAEKSARGRLKGQAGRIQVVVRSAEGNIVVK